MDRRVPLALFLLGCATSISSSSWAGTVTGDPFAGNTSFSALFEEEKEVQEQTTHELGIHGYLESRNRLRITDGEALSTRQRGWLEFEGSWYGTQGAVADAPYRFFTSSVLDIDPAAADLSDDHSTTRLYIEEAFLTIDQNHWDIIVGQKIQRIGTGDGINPLDLINPLDYRDPVANGRSDARQPILLGLATVQLPVTGSIQEASFDGVFIPLAQVNQLNAPGSPWESPGLAQLRQADSNGELVLESQQQPNQYFEESEFGVRAAVTLLGWDLAIIGFSTYSDSPVFSRSFVNDNGVETLHVTPIHPRYTAVGCTFAKGLERSTLRGELAVKPDLPVMLSDPKSTPGYERRLVTEGVMGWDRTFFINLYTNIQYFFTLTDNAEPTINDQFSHGISYDVHDLFLQDELEAGVRGIISFSGEGWTFETYAEYQPVDDWLLVLSLLFYEGPDDGLYGQYGENDSITLRLRYSF